MSVFRIYDPDTNTYSSGGAGCKFTKGGKSWAGRGAFHNHLSMVIRYDIYAGNFSTWPELFLGDYLQVIDRAVVIEYKNDGSQVHYSLKHYLLSYAVGYITRATDTRRSCGENYIKAKNIIEAELSVTTPYVEAKKSLTQDTVDSLEEYFSSRTGSVVQSWICLKQILNLVPTKIEDTKNVD